MRNDLGIDAFTYSVSDTAGVARRRVVVRNATSSSNKYFTCKNPAGANAAAAVLAGITRAGANDTEQVGVSQYGYEECEAASAITQYAVVNVADTVGRVKAATESAGTINVVGVAMQSAAAAGDIIMVDLKRLGTIA